MIHFQKSYDIVLGGMFDKQYGGLVEEKENEYQECLKFLLQTYKSLLKFVLFRENSCKIPCLVKKEKVFLSKKIRI